ETLMLEDKSRSKMLQKQNEPIMSKKKVITKPVDYAALNQLLKDFETLFIPQTELLAEQAFWSRYSVPSEEPSLSSSTTIVEVPKELPKVSMGKIHDKNGILLRKATWYGFGSKRNVFRLVDLSSYVTDEEGIELEEIDNVQQDSRTNIF
nr:hypothetical protein [Tanacetum cinerariifolium]